MNAKQLVLLLIALAILGGAGLVLFHRNEDTWTASEQKLGGKLLPNFQVNDVAAIHIKGDTELTLTHKNDGWTVAERGDYPANITGIRELLLKFNDLKIAESDPIGPSQYARVQLEDPGKGTNSGTLLEFKDAQGKVLNSLLLGKKHTREPRGGTPAGMDEDQIADGRFVLLPDDPQNVIVISDPLTSVDPAPAQWIKKDFFKVEKPKTISMVSTNAANSWKLTRESETSPWVLADAKPGEKLDTNKVSSLGNSLNYASFVDVAANPSPEESGLDKPVTLTLETFDHLTYTIQVGNKNPEGNYYMTVAVTGDLPSARTPGTDEKPDDQKRLDKEFADKTKQLQDKLKQESALNKYTYLVSSWTLDPLIRDRSQLFEEKKEDKKDDKLATP